MNRVWLTGAAYTPDEQHDEPVPRVTVPKRSFNAIRRNRAYTYGQSNPTLRPVVPAGF